jgi:hypothetical protein
VSQQLTVAELTKAARNLKKIELYLTGRRGWRVDPSDNTTFKTLRVAADRLAFTIGQRALALRIDAKLGGETETEELPSATFESGMLQKFSVFLGQLDGWFVSQADAAPEKGAERLLGRLQASLDAIRTALIVIDDNQEPVEDGEEEAADDDRPVEAPPETEHPAAAVPGPPVRPVTTASDDIYEGTRATEGEAVPSRKPPPQIAFTMSDAAPMFTWIGSETVELTPLAKEKIEKLFDDQGISYFKYQLEKFCDEVRMRIETAPEGHVLVVKIRSMDNEIKPFLSYVAADTVE